MEDKKLLEEEIEIVAVKTNFLFSFAPHQNCYHLNLTSISSAALR